MPDEISPEDLLMTPDEEDVYNLLVQLEMPDLFQVLITEKIRLQDLHHLDNATALALLQGRVAFHRIVAFQQRLGQYQRSERTRTVACGPEASLFETIVNVGLIGISGCASSEPLSDHERNKVVTRITQYCIDKRYAMTQTLRDNLARIICKRLPGEDPYFYSDDGLRHGGKDHLYTVYRAMRYQRMQGTEVKPEKTSVAVPVAPKEEKVDKTPANVIVFVPMSTDVHNDHLQPSLATVASPKKRPAIQATPEKPPETTIESPPTAKKNRSFSDGELEPSSPTLTNKTTSTTDTDNKENIECDRNPSEATFAATGTDKSLRDIIHKRLSQTPTNSYTSPEQLNQNVLSVAFEKSVNLTNLFRDLSFCQNFADKMQLVLKTRNRKITDQFTELPFNIQMSIYLAILPHLLDPVAHPELFPPAFNHFITLAADASSFVRKVPRASDGPFVGILGARTSPVAYVLYYKQRLYETVELWHALDMAIRFVIGDGASVPRDTADVWQFLMVYFYNLADSIVVVSAKVIDLITQLDNGS